MTETLKAMPVRDRLEKIVAVEERSALTQHHMPKMKALRAVNRKFEVCAWRAEG